MKRQIRKGIEEGESKFPSFDVLLKNGQITQDEYLFLHGGQNVPEIFRRVEDISRSHGMAGISGVFYALEERRISIAKAMEVIRHYLLSGKIEEYEAPRGEWDEEKEISQLKMQIAKLQHQLDDKNQSSSSGE